jgi:Transglycosylase-like domain
MASARNATVPRLLTKRRHIAVITLILLAFPAAALAASDSGGAAKRPAVAEARVAIAPLQRAAERFDRMVRKIGHRIEVRRRIAARRHRRQLRREQFASLPGGVSLSTLEAIASCESGGDPAAVSSDGTYRGKYQFDYGTWESVGGSGDPAAAPEEEQDYRAALLYAQSGSSPWPICG